MKTSPLGTALNWVTCFLLIGSPFDVAAEASPWLALRDGTKLTLSAESEGAVAAGRALASADFDEDGVPDLVTSYESSQGGRLFVQRGNVDAIYPNSAEAKARKLRGEFTAAAFLPAAESLALPETADFLGAGDFDADGHWDIVAARSGGSKLQWLRGDGRGNFTPAQTIELVGAVTALATGEINRADGLTDIAVGVAGADGPQALVFESPEGALRHAPEIIRLSAPATDFAFGGLSENAWQDLAIASGNEVVVVHGRDRKLSLDGEAQARVAAAELSRSAFAAAVQSIAVGDFAGDAKQELAVLTADGVVHVGDSAAVAAVYDRRLAAGDQMSAVMDRRYRLVAAKVSSLPKHDLVVFGATGGVQIVTTSEPDDTSGELTIAAGAEMNVAAAVTSRSEVTAVLPMRLNADALSDLVLLNGDPGAPVVIESHGTGVFVVNSTGNTADKTPGDGVCEDADGNCSFKAAQQESNAHPGTDTISFNIPGAAVPVIILSDSIQFTETVTIDGTTQAAGRVEIGAPFSPLQMFANNCVVRGLATYTGNFSNAIHLRGSGNVIEGNYIGFKADVTSPGLGNFTGGVLIDGGGANNLIGGTAAQARNVLSNCHTAIQPSGAGAGTTVRGNYIGTNPAGSAAFANNYAFFTGGAASDITLGGTTAGAGNVISASAIEVIVLNEAAVIQGNFFGTTADGMQPLANGGTNITVQGSKAVTIGGTTSAARNVISAGGPQGILSNHGGPGSCLVQGNFIGTNAAGAGALPNAGVGVHLGLNGTVVGGTASGAGNLISGNADDGVRIVGRDMAWDNIVQGNLIGTDVTGTLPIPNAGDGVEINAFGRFGSQRNLVGGSVAGARNVISGNRDNGVNLISSPDTHPNRVEGNYIGLNRFGTGALGNKKHGVLYSGAGNNVGGSSAGAGNLIAHNAGAGIASSSGRQLGGAILSNSIFRNVGLGIDKGGDGVTAYNGDYGEAPVITSVVSSGSSTAITGTLRTYTDGQTTVTIQFFSNSSLDPTGYGEGETFVGETTVTQPGYTAEVSFSATITPAIPGGRFVTAVAVGPSGPNSPRIYSSEFAFSARVAGEATPENVPLRINLATPSVGGDLGDVTITIIGEGIAQGATVRLRRAGQEDIESNDFAVAPDGSSMQVSFDLNGKLQGQWDIVVTNPDGTTSTLPATFTIQQGVDAQVWVDIIGRSVARPGRPQSYFVVYGNRGNTDANGVLLALSMPPNSTFKVISNLGVLSPDEWDPNHESVPAGVDWSQFEPYLEFDDERILPFLVPVIPAGGSGAINIQVTFPDEGSGVLEAAISRPFLESSATTTDQVAASARSKGAALEAPPILRELRRLRKEVVDELGKRYIKPDGNVDLARLKSEQEAAQRAFDKAHDFLQPGEDPPLDSTTAALLRANARLAKGQTAQALIAAARAGKKGLDLTKDGAASLLGAVKQWGQDAVLAPFKKEAKTFFDYAKKDIQKQWKQKLPILKKKIIDFVLSRDPNEKVGPSGGGMQRFVTGLDPIPYGIFFENKAEATAAAQDVVITDQLDTTKFDLATFQLGPVSFGNDTIVIPPPNLSEWTADVDLRPANNLIVRIIAVLDKTSGLVTWRFFSIDPATNQPTDDPLAGFLPPNKNAPEGEGVVTFTVQPKANQPDGTQIRNQARIVFDANAPIDTAEWLNTIDRTPPASEVLALPSTNSAARFEVAWRGSDAVSGVAYYTIYVSENGGPFTVWLVNTMETSAFFQGRPSTTYTFYSVAEDGAGNREAAPIAADTSITTLAGQLLNISTRMRVQTGENVLIGGLIVTGSDPKRVLLRAIGPSLRQQLDGVLADPILDLYQGETLLASNDNWKDSQQGEIEGTTIPPSDDLESAMIRTLAPGSYTAVMSGKDGGVGIGLVEAYDLDQRANSRLANISTRGFVEGGDNVMIGGLIVGGSGGADTRVFVRALGPSLAGAGVANALADPTLELVDINGNVVRANDNWQESQQGDIEATTIPPPNAAESAMVITLTPGSYTAVVRGNNNSNGVALVEVYNLP